MAEENVEKTSWTRPRKPRGARQVNADIYIDHKWPCGPVHSCTDADRHRRFTQPQTPQ